MTRLPLLLGFLLVALMPLFVNGCYTQVGTVRSDDETQYGVEDEENAAQPDSVINEDQYSGDRYGSPYPYNGYGYCYPGLSVSFGWYSNPWCWGGYPYYYDPFWGPPIYAASYWPYYYNGYYPVPYYNYYHSPYASYIPYYYGGGSTSHGATRTFGNSRGSGVVRGGAPVTRYPGTSLIGRVRAGSTSGPSSTPVSVSQPQAPSGRSARTNVTGQPKGVETGRGSGRTTKTSKEATPQPRPSPINREGTGTNRNGGQQVSRPSPSRSPLSAPSPSSSGGNRGSSSSPRGRLRG